MLDSHRITVEPHVSDDRLLDALERWRVVDTAAGPQVLIPSLRAIEAHRAMIEHAKGALMLRFGIDSHQAFAVLVRWARVTHIPVPAIAEALVHGICEGSPGTEVRERALVRWLEAQMRHHLPELAPLPARRARARTGT